MRIEIQHSSSITFSHYNEKTHHLVIGFDSGGVYRYANVPPTVIKAFNKAKSKGLFVNKVIKTQFQHQQLS